MKIEKEVEKCLNKQKQSVAHRKGHIRRVMKYALRIAKNYKTVDLEVLKIAVLLHDICQPFNEKEKHVTFSLKLAKKILEKIGYPKNKTKKSSGNNFPAFYRKAS